MHAGGRSIVAESICRTSSRLAEPLEPVRASVDPIGLGRRPHSRTCRRLTSPASIPSASRDSRLRLDVRARDRPALPNQSELPGTTGRPVITGPIVAAWFSLSRSASDLLSIRRLSWGFRSPSAHAGCDALSGAAGLRTIPLQRLLPLTRALDADQSARGRPCGFAPRQSKAASLEVADVREGLSCSFVYAPRGRGGLTLMSNLFPSSSIDSCRWFRGNRNITLASDPTTFKRFRLDPLPYPGHAPSRSFRAVYRYPWCGLSQPDQAIGLPSCSPGGALGVLALRSFVPHRVERHLCHSGPTCRSRLRARPD